MRSGDRAPAEQVALVAFALGALALVSPLRRLWAYDGAPFWAPFAVWAALVGLCALSALWGRGEGR